MNSQKRLNIPGHGRTLINWISHKPYRALLLGVLMACLLLPGYRWFTLDFTYMTWFFEGDSAVQEYRNFEDFFGNDETIMIAVHSPSGVFDRETATLVSELTEAMWLLPDVMRVDSLANFDWTHSVDQAMVVEPLLPAPDKITDQLLKSRKQVALEHEILPGYLIGKDAKTTMLIARLRPVFLEKPIDNPAIVAAARKLISGFEGRGDHSFHLSGQPV